MTTICFVNQKGGCGKSSTCLHLAGALQSTDRRILLVDADPQGSLSQGFFGSEAVETLAPEQTLAAVFDESVYARPDALLMPTRFDGITVVPTNHHLGIFNRPSPEKEGITQYALRSFLEDVSGFDFVLIDCPPNLYSCTWAALIAADYVVIPVPPEDFGTQGLRAVRQAIERARELNPTLRQLGFLVTRCDRRLLIHRAYEQRLRKNYSNLVLDTVVPEAAAFKVATASRKPVEYHDAKSLAASTMRGLARELCARIAKREQRQRAA